MTIKPLRIRPRTAGDRNAPSSADASVDVEAKLVRLQDQFEQLRAQVRQAQQLSTLGTAAAMIAHEVNNLLTPILSYARAALQADDNNLREKALTVTVKNVEMLQAMSEHVLRLGAAKPPVREAVNVRSVVDDAIASLCRDLSRDGIHLKIDVDGAVEVLADPLQLQQVLFNLFLNAREAMAANHAGRLEVRAVVQERRVVLTVHDNGGGIPADLLEHIFDPFQSSKSSRRKGQPRCSGLGLALCRELIEENKGDISVASDPQSGTTFTITLPMPSQELP